MEIRKLTPEMLSFRLGADPEIDPDWFVAHLNDIIRFDPDGCFALCDGDSVVGMITSTTYQKIGWLGWLFVLEEYRFRGYGERLMRAATEYVQARGASTVVLEADVKAVNLYRRLGFIEQFHTRHYSLSRGEFECGTSVGVEVDVVRISDLTALSEFDRSFFREDRSRLFGIVMANKNFRGLVAKHDGRIVGYIFTNEASANQQVSPFIVDLSHKMARTAQRALVKEALKVCEKPLYFRIPVLGEGYGGTLERLGAKPVYYHTVRMYFGSEYKTEREGVLSLGCPGKG
ncbi:MAG: GNAT family N-acetyltransferase [Candidatus Zixiibacteriota bacterium]